jgi:hypothetical protein
VPRAPLKEVVQQFRRLSVSRCENRFKNFLARILSAGRQPATPRQHNAIMFEDLFDEDNNDTEIPAWTLSSGSGASTDSNPSLFQKNRPQVNFAGLLNQYVHYYPFLLQHPVWLKIS